MFVQRILMRGIKLILKPYSAYPFLCYWWVPYALDMLELFQPRLLHGSCSKGYMTPDCLVAW